MHWKKSVAIELLVYLLTFWEIHTTKKVKYVGDEVIDKALKAGLGRNAKSNEKLSHP